MSISPVHMYVVSVHYPHRMLESIPQAPYRAENDSVVISLTRPRLPSRCFPYRRIHLSHQCCAALLPHVPSRHPCPPPTHGNGDYDLTCTQAHSLSAQCLRCPGQTRRLCRVPYVARRRVVYAAPAQEAPRSPRAGGQGKTVGDLPAAADACARARACSAEEAGGHLPAPATEGAFSTRHDRHARQGGQRGCSCSYSAHQARTGWC